MFILEIVRLKRLKKAVVEKHKSKNDTSPTADAGLPGWTPKTL